MPKVVDVMRADPPEKPVEWLYLRLVLQEDGSIRSIEFKDHAFEGFSILAIGEGIVGDDDSFLTMEDGEKFLDNLWHNVRGPFMRATKPYEIADPQNPESLEP
jgi:hypothetical protein